MRTKTIASALGALLLLLQGPALAQGAPRDFILRGNGATMSCGAWIELRTAAGGYFAADKRATYQSTLGWALGYLSGAARFGQDHDPLRDMDEEATIAWLVEHCSTNPATGFRLALEAFIEAHPPR
jgi:hypothetical protein